MSQPFIFHLKLGSVARTTAVVQAGSITEALERLGHAVESVTIKSARQGRSRRSGLVRFPELAGRRLMSSKPASLPALAPPPL